MRKLFSSLLILIVTLASAQTLPQDASVRKGTLSNGLTYYIRHNHLMPDVAEFYIAQRVGSILEEPRQRGLDHFLEHMAFNGTVNFPGAEKGGLREWCESKGIKFGTNLNAYTSVDQTVYNISSAPVNKEGVTDTCLLILHDWSHFLLLEDEEIDKERGVIHEEWRTRRAGMAMQRMMEDATPVVYKGTKYEDCLPIGSMDIVDHFPYQDLRDYYQKWYRPDLQAIIVVGDIDVDEIEQKIKKVFSGIPSPVNPAERIYYPVNDNERMIVYQQQDAEQPITLFTLYMKRDATPREQRNQEDFYADGYKSDIIRQAVNDRLRALTDQANPPFISGSMRDGSFYLSTTKDAISGFCSCKQEDVLGSIKALVSTLERVRQHGLTQSEIDIAKAELLRWAESDYAERDKKRNGTYVRMCLQNFLENEPMLSAEDELNLVRKLHKTVTLADINAAVKELITDKNQVVTLYGPDKDGFKLPTNEEVEKAILEVQAQKYKAPKKMKIPTALMKKLPKSGSIVSEQDVTNGYREFVLSNGMHVYARSTDFEADNISMSMFSLGGQSIYPDEDVPSMSYLSGVLRASGVDRFDDATLDKMLAGKTARVNPFVGDETEGMNGNCSVKDFETMMQLVYLYFTSPRRDNQAFESLMNRQRDFLKNRDANPNVSYNDSITAIVYGHHPRMKPVKLEDLPQVSLDRIMQIYKERFSDASDFNVIFTGNIDFDVFRKMICQYLASLPSKHVKESIIDRHTDIRPVDEVHTFQKHQATPSALTNIYFTAPIEYTSLNDLKLSALCQIMRMVYTEKVREEKGGTYGVSVEGSMQKHPKDEALLHINFRTDPDKYEELIPIIYSQLDSMAINGPKPEDLDKVKKYELKTYGQYIVLNDYWAQVKYEELFNGVDLNKDYPQLIESLTCEDIRQFASLLLSYKHRIQVTMIPDGESSVNP